MNAFYEEKLWRGSIFDRLRGTFWTKALVVAAAFGVVHWNALPSGMIGVTLTFAFSVGSSIVRKLGDGALLLSIFAHSIADVVLLRHVIGR